MDAEHKDRDAPAIPAAERYERGLTLKKAGLYQSAIEQFEWAARAPDFALRAYAKIGLCCKSAGKNEDAVRAFQRALQASPGSSQETVPILYMLGRTLESLGRTAETLEAYRWIRREDPHYRDVGSRIEQLSTGRLNATGQQPQKSSWAALLRFWHGFVK
jgi:tetratricopeptide (TPR) repeat protein